MLSSITLENFKSFKQARVDFGPLTLIIGANGSGKSNLFDALRFLRSIGAGNSIRDAIEGHVAAVPSVPAVPGIRGGSPAITHLASEKREFTLEVVARLKSERIEYLLSVDAGRYRVLRERLKSSQHGGPYVFDTHPETGPLRHNVEAPSISARFYKNTRGVNPKREFSPNVSILSQFTGRNAESTANERVAMAMRAELGAIRPLELRPEVLRNYSSLGQFELGEHGENFAALVWVLIAEAEANDDEAKEAEERLDTIRAWMNELTPHHIEDFATESTPTGEVIFAVVEAPFLEETLTARSLSDGTLRFAALTFAILGSRNRRTFVIEELENGINPGRQALLVQMLEQAAGHPSQVIASTHGPGILDFASEQTLAHALIMGWDHENSTSRAVRISKLEGFDDVRKTSTLGSLHTEGWFQFAADI